LCIPTVSLSSSLSLFVSQRLHAFVHNKPCSVILSFLPHPFSNFITLFSSCNLSSYFLYCSPHYRTLVNNSQNSDTGDIFGEFYTNFFLFRLHNFNHFLFMVILGLLSTVHNQTTIVMVSLNIFYIHFHNFFFVWYPGLELRVYILSHFTRPFYVRCFRERIS
jgi:hypothetical protein